MGRKRYLIYFSYIGTQFRGVQRQVSREVISSADPSTVQGLIEYALVKLQPTCPVILQLSSRTDQGVHALRTAASVDLEFLYPMDTLYMLNFLNGFFEKTDLDIRILDVVLVRKDFNARALPLWRKYIYRFATVKPSSDLSDKLLQKKLLPIPITENHRCFFVPTKKFDTEIINQAAGLFIGTKDFRSFKIKSPNDSDDDTTIRRIDELYIEPTHPFLNTSLDEHYQYWHLVCQGKSFLYKQIRRMVAILVAVGQRKVSINTVEKMIQHPAPNLMPSGICTAPSGGLYLADVYYDPKDLEIPEDEREPDPKPEPKPEPVVDDMDPLERSKILIKERLKKYQQKQSDSC